MKRFGIFLLAAMLGLVLALGCQEEKKAPAKPAAPPAKTEQVAPQAPPAAPAPAAPAPAAPAPAAATQPAASPPPDPNAPRYAGDGFVAPQLAEKNCIAENLRLPSQLGASAPEMVTARAAISATGQPTTVQVMGQVADARISEAVRRAVQSCRWIPGADAEGKPTALWVVLPIRLSR